MLLSGTEYLHGLEEQRRFSILRDSSGLPDDEQANQVEKHKHLKQSLENLLGKLTRYHLCQILSCNILKESYMSSSPQILTQGEYSLCAQRSMLHLCVIGYQYLQQQEGCVLDLAKSLAIILKKPDMACH